VLFGTKSKIMSEDPVAGGSRIGLSNDVLGSGPVAVQNEGQQLRPVLGGARANQLLSGELRTAHSN